MPVEPGGMSPSSVLMNWCSISVEPMPSMISMPVACFQASNVAAGSVSPAEMQRRRLERS